MLDSSENDDDRSGEESSSSVGGGNENDEKVYVDVMKPKQFSTETANQVSSQVNNDAMPDTEDDVNDSGAVLSSLNEEEGEGRNQIVAGNQAILSEMEDSREELYAKGNLKPSSRPRAVIQNQLKMKVID